jgi:hypothetical protein
MVDGWELLEITSKQVEYIHILAKKFPGFELAFDPEILNRGEASEVIDSLERANVESLVSRDILRSKRKKSSKYEFVEAMKSRLEEEKLKKANYKILQDGSKIIVGQMLYAKNGEAVEVRKLDDCLEVMYKGELYTRPYSCIGKTLLLKRNK